MAIIRNKRTKLDNYIKCHSVAGKGVEVLLNIDDVMRIQVHQDSYSSRYKKKQQYTDIFFANGNSVIVSENLENIKKQLENCVI
jgi:hypothetical protein